MPKDRNLGHSASKLVGIGMESVALFVRSPNAAENAHREATASRVLRHFAAILPAPERATAICYLDSEDAWWLRESPGGIANRGMHWPIRGRGLHDWPQYMWDVVAHVDSRNGEVSWPYDCLVYLHGTTCESDLGLTLTLAHELQHFLQYSNHRDLWAINALLMSLPGLPRGCLSAWKDFPLEREARIVAKRTAEDLFGADSVRSHIRMMIDAHLTEQDAADWAFVQGIDCSAPYDPVLETKRLVFEYENELIQVQRGLTSPRDADITSVNLKDWT